LNFISIDFLTIIIRRNNKREIIMIEKETSPDPSTVGRFPRMSTTEHFRGFNIIQYIIIGNHISPRGVALACAQWYGTTGTGSYGDPIGRTPKTRFDTQTGEGLITHKKTIQTEMSPSD
jgi:hypothetical protein